MALRLCLVDLDRTLVEERTIERLARAFDVEAAVASALRRGDGEPAAGAHEAARVMAVFAGVDAAAFASVCATHVLREGASQMVQGLRALGFTIGVASASYVPAAQAVQRRLGLDLAFGVEPEVRDGRLTGRLLPSGHDGPCGLHLCKESVLRGAAAPAAFTVAVGDGENDVCMLRWADLGVGVEPCAPRVREEADVVVPHLSAVPAVVAARLQRASDDVGVVARPKA